MRMNATFLLYKQLAYPMKATSGGRIRCVSKDYSRKIDEGSRFLEILSIPWIRMHWTRRGEKENLVGDRRISLLTLFKLIKM